MNKSEMEQHRAAYYRYMSAAMLAIKQDAFSEAIRSAISSWDHIDGMMQYERKYDGKESFDVAAIDLVLHYAPLLFDEESIDRLEALLKDQRRIAKYANANLEAGLAKARATMWDAHRLWDDVESRSGAAGRGEARRPSENREQQLQLLGEWSRMGLIYQTGKSGRVSLATDMDQAIPTRCPSCGIVAKATKAKVLDKRHCPKCRSSVSFVLLASESARRS